MLRFLTTSLILIGLSLSGLPAQADPLIRAGGEPGVIRAWSEAGGVLTLTIAEGFDTAEVAELVKKRAPKTTLRALGDRLEVRGISKAALRRALRGAKVDPLLDDVDVMLSSLQGGSGGDSDSGSSIRATQHGGIGREVRLSGQVVNVRRERFPVVLLTVQLAEAAAGQAAGDRVVVIPQIRTKRGRPQDPASKKNLKAWYAQPGDKVSMRLVRPKQRVWAVTDFSLTAPEW